MGEGREFYGRIREFGRMGIECKGAGMEILDGLYTGTWSRAGCKGSILISRKYQTTGKVHKFLYAIFLILCLRIHSTLPRTFPATRLNSKAQLTASRPEGLTLIVGRMVTGPLVMRAVLEHLLDVVESR